MQFGVAQEKVLTYSIFWVSLKKPFLLVSNSLSSEAEGPHSPADVVPRSQRHSSFLTVQHEGGQEGHENPHRWEEQQKMNSVPHDDAYEATKQMVIYTRQHSTWALDSSRTPATTKKAFAWLPGTLNGPVHKESPWAVSDIVEPAIMTVLQNPHEEERSQPADRTWLTHLHINQDIIH